jgi:paraquat-inducible protein B
LRTATDELIRHLIARGYRARLAQRPALIGGLVINLDAVKAAASATLLAGTPPIIPSTDGGSSIDDVTDHVAQILAKVDSVPITAIGQDIKSITGNLNRLISSPELSDSLQHLDSSLAQVDQVMTEVRPQIGPLVQKLNQVANEVSGTAAAAQAILNGQGGNVDASVPAAIQQLTEAARSVRALADYLDRHPEALIQGKGKDK